jgi:hypothetical protein
MQTDYRSSYKITEIMAIKVVETVIEGVEKVFKRRSQFK